MVQSLYKFYQHYHSLITGITILYTITGVIVTTATAAIGYHQICCHHCCHYQQHHNHHHHPRHNLFYCHWHHDTLNNIKSWCNITIVIAMTIILFLSSFLDFQMSTNDGNGLLNLYSTLENVKNSWGIQPTATYLIVRFNVCHSPNICGSSAPFFFFAVIFHLS